MVKKIGFVTEGDAEITSLPELFPQFASRTGHQFLRPIRANVDPTAPVPVIVKGVAERVRLAQARGAGRVVVLLDREQIDATAAKRALEIETGLIKVCGPEVRVVIKDRMYENWLLACPGAFKTQKGRFPNHALVEKIKSGTADAVAAPATMIGRTIGKGSYEKVADAQRLMKKADIDALAANSRSFRRLLAVVGDKVYAAGSCQYVAP